MPAGARGVASLAASHRGGATVAGFPRPWQVRLLLLSVLVVVAAGCRLEVVADMTVEPNGTGAASLVVIFDAELASELDRLEIDPATEVLEAAARVGEWEARREADPDGVVTLTLTRPVTAPTEFGAAYRDLASGLRERDPALVVDLDVAVSDAGGVQLEGGAGLRPPATAGASIDGEPVGPAGPELAALVEQTTSARLVVTLPGPVREHDADRVDGRTVVWDLPVGTTRAVTARSDPPPGLPLPARLAAAAGLALVVLGAAGWAWRRRR